MTVDCTVRDYRDNLLAALTGRLTMADISRVRVNLFKCLAEQPPALLVDLSRLEVQDKMALAVFTAVARQAALWPGTPILLCAATPRTSVLLAAAAYRRIPRFASVDAALERMAGGGPVMPAITETLLPIAGAPRHSRNIATEACARWNVPELTADASLVCSELISNGIDHAGTMMTLRLSLGTAFFFIAVRDGSTVEPRVAEDPPGRARGLRVVALTAHSWGCLPANDGKVVWASLRLGGVRR
jgi:anti-anti-sigma regulatory factor